MRRVLAGPLFLLACSAGADDHSVLREHCRGEWPDDYRMRKYCEELARNGLSEIRRFITRRGAQPGTVSGLILDRCADQWPEDFRMMAYCIEMQEKAAMDLGELSK